MLLSFAQFEREVTGERIRDKIAASKQKGLWMGGLVPLGYEPNGRTLAIDEAEAVTVRTLFRLYLELGTVRQVKEAADRLGLKTKIRRGAHPRGGRPLSRGHIYKLLSNTLYVGRIAHRGKLYDGQHAAIVDAETWERVQTALAVHTRDRSSRARASDPSPLMGKLVDETGVALTPTHAVKSGRRYRYYVSRHLITRSDKSDAETQGWRLPAGEIERILREAVATLLADRAALTHAARESDITIDRIPGLLESAARWRGEGLDLVQRVRLSPDEIAITLDIGPLTCETGMMVRHLVPASQRRRGVEMRLVLEGAGHGRTSKPDPALIKAVARARRWFDDLVNGRARSFADIAAADRCSERYISRLMPLAFLAPEILEAVLSGTQPANLTAETLTRRAGLPLSWAEQKASLGFDG
jgi:hypothetical protein